MYQAGQPGQVIHRFPNTERSQLIHTAHATQRCEEFPAKYLTLNYGVREPCRATAEWSGCHGRYCPPSDFYACRGRWLDRAKFAIGSRVRVRVTLRRLIIDLMEETPAADRAPRLPRDLGERVFANRYKPRGPTRPRGVETLGAARAGNDCVEEEQAPRKRQTLTPS